MTTPTTSEFVGLAATIYNKTWTTGQKTTINGAEYLVLDAVNDTSNGYYGAILLDQRRTHYSSSIGVPNPRAGRIGLPTP